MADKPMIFSASMVRALMDGRKSQTRRVLKPQPEHLQVYDWRGKRIHDSEYRHWCWKGRVGADNWDSITAQLMPALPYAVGDRLWVRENLRSNGRVWNYAADDAPIRMMRDDPRATAMVAWAHHQEREHCPSIHMPRWASRITLTVTAVRVERLQEISEADALAEGAWKRPDGYWTHDGESGAAGLDRPIRNSFWIFWEMLHGPGAWEANPWVAAISFTTELRNIDSPPASGARG